MSTASPHLELRAVITALGTRDWSWRPWPGQSEGVWQLAYSDPDADMPTGLAAVGEVLTPEAQAIQALSPRNLQRIVQGEWLNLGVQQRVRSALDDVRRVRGRLLQSGDVDLESALRHACGLLEQSLESLAHTLAPLGMSAAQLRLRPLLDDVAGPIAGPADELSEDDGG